MAKDKDFRTFSIDDIEYQFNVGAFKMFFQNHKTLMSKANEKNYPAYRLYEDIAAAIGVSDETIKKWHQGSNGPVDVEMIQSLANFFDVDLMDLLTRKEQEKMAKEESTFVTDEKDVIGAVYQKIIDIINLEVFRFKEERFGTDYLQTEDFLKKDNALKLEAFDIIDRHSLMISSDTRIKLYNLLAEIGTSISDMENAPGRWLRLNPLFFDAREYYREGGFTTNEAERISALRKDIEGSIERPYHVETTETYNGKAHTVYMEGFHKETTTTEVLNMINKGREDKLSSNDIKLIPYDDFQFGPFYNPDEIFKYEYVKTVLLILQEDFPHYYKEIGG